MALGGGTFAAQNKKLPGTYINFVSAARANDILSDRGVATMPFVQNWGRLGEIVEVSAVDVEENSLKLFGYVHDAPEMKPIRELYRNIRLGYLWRLGEGGTAASNAYGTAACVGTRGNALTLVVAPNVDNEGLMDVSVFLDSALVSTQSVAQAAQLVDDAFVIYDKTEANTLEPTAGMPFEGGEDPTVSPADFQAYLDAAEGYSFNAMGCPSSDDTIKALFTAFTHRLRDELGVKFQCVSFNSAADFEGVVNVKNKVTDAGTDPYALVYWVTGICAGVAVSQSNMNRVYDGEYTVDVAYTQAQLEDTIQNGGFILHRVGSDIRVLADINSFVSVTAEKLEIFKENQTIRVIDQIANYIAVLFNTRYLGVIPNDASGRVSLWSDVVKFHTQLQDMRAIEGFTGADVVIAAGNNPRAVVVSVKITIVNAMTQLYMTVNVS